MNAQTGTWKERLKTPDDLNLPASGLGARSQEIS